MEFREHKLPNGLEIVAECNPQAYSMAVGFFVNTGSRDETPQLSGVSHFLEHMTFKGTASRSAADVNRELDEMGSHSNAYTSEEQTVYYSAVLPEYQDRVVELMCDIMRPALRDEDFQTEKHVILEEIAKYDDQPPFGAYEKCMAAHFGQHPLGHNILGTVESVGLLTPQQMQAYFRQRYSPANMTLVAAGNVDFARLVRAAQQHCGGWEALEALRDTSPPATHLGFQVIHNELATQQYVVQLTNGPAAEDEIRYAARLLYTVLGDDSGSRMFWDLIDTGRAEYASMAPHEFQGAGVALTYLCCAAEDTADNLLRVHDLLREAQGKGISEEELTQARNKVVSHIVLSSERPANRLFSVGNNWVQRRQYRTVREVVDAYQRVTRQAITEVLERYPPALNTTVAVGPLRDLVPPKWVTGNRVSG